MRCPHCHRTIGVEVVAIKATGDLVDAQTRIEDLRLRCRTKSALRRGKVAVLGDMAGWGIPDFLCLKDFGEVALLDVQSMLIEHGMRITGPYTRWDEERFGAKFSADERLWEGYSPIPPPPP